MVVVPGSALTTVLPGSATPGSVMTAAPPFFHGRDEVCHNLFALVPCQELRYPLCLPPPGVPDMVLPVD